jgi:hypothetical protein
MSFIYGSKDQSPGAIDNTALANKIISSGISNLERNVDFYDIPIQTWRQLYLLYRGGPAIILHITGKIEIVPE